MTAAADEARIAALADSLAIEEELEQVALELSIAESHRERHRGGASSSSGVGGGVRRDTDSDNDYDGGGSGGGGVDVSGYGVTGDVGNTWNNTGYQVEDAMSSLSLEAKSDGAKAGPSSAGSSSHAGQSTSQEFSKTR